MTGSRESRRGARVEASFLVAIDGIDAEPVPRSGDISATGIYFEVDQPVGEVGSVQWLRVASADRRHKIHLMAHVIRSVTLDDLDGGRSIGVAFEFMPESEEAAKAVENFVQYVLVLADDTGDAALEPRLDAMSSAAVGTAVVRQLSVRTMTIEANWTVAPGDHIRVDIAAPGMSRRVRLEGSAKRIAPIDRGHRGPPYAIEIEFESEIDRPPRRASSMTFAAVRPEMMPPQVPEKVAPPPKDGAPPPDDEISRALDDLFSALIHPPKAESVRPRREHLSGLLSRIRLPTLCALLDMERLSGHLVLQKGDERVVIYVSEGRLIDVEGMGDSLLPRAKIAKAFNWDEGSFVFDVQPVDRPDRIGVGTTALLLDIAREEDEASQKEEARSNEEKL
jgi:hypothetical protein